MIRGWFEPHSPNGWPLVQLRISVPGVNDGAGATGTITFLMDTGSTVTIVSREDAERWPLGIQVATDPALHGAGHIFGVGGGEQSVRADAMFYAEGRKWPIAIHFLVPEHDPKWNTLSAAQKNQRLGDVIFKEKVMEIFGENDKI